MAKEKYRALSATQRTIELCVAPVEMTFFGFERTILYYSFLERLILFHGFSCEVVETEGQQGEHQDADPVVVEGIVVAEVRKDFVCGSFVESCAYAHEADDAARSYKAGGVE